jgi:hypothetical protein
VGAATRILGRVVLALGWAAFLFLAALFLAEKTGLVTHFARRLLAESTGPLGVDLAIDRASLRWFVPGVEVRGIRLGTRGEMLEIDEASLAFDLFASDGPRIARIDVAGGHVRLSPELFDRLWLLADRLPPRVPGMRHTASIPSIRARDVELDLDTKRLGRLPLGVVDLAVRVVPNGGPVLTGRLIPSLSTAPGGSGEIVLAGQESEPGTFDLSASAVGVPISTTYLPRGTDLDALRPFAPHGVLALRAWGTLSLDSHTPPRGGVRLVLADGGFVTASHQPIEGLQVELETSYAPKSPENLWGLTAWTASSRISGTWRDVPFGAVARLSDEHDPDRSITCQLHVPKLPATHDVVDLLGNRPEDESLWKALEPRGSVELWAMLGCATDWVPGEPIAEKLAAACEFAFAGDAGITYRGFPGHASTMRNQGFPLPVDGMRGSVVLAFDPTRVRTLVVGIPELHGTPAHGTLEARGWVTSPPRTAPHDAPGVGYVELDLDVRGEHIPVDATLHSALAGLAGAVPPAETWEPFHPTGGELDAVVRVMRTVEMPYAATRVSLGLTDLSLAWKDLPIPVGRVRGKLEFVSDGREDRGLGCRLSGSARTSADLSVALRYQTDPSVPVPAGGKSRLDEIACLAVSAHRVSLTGDDERILAQQFEAIGSAMASVSPHGFADVTYSQVRAGPGPRRVIVAEVTPREAELIPSDFRIPAGSVRGRVLVNAVEERPDAPTRTETLVAPLVGTLNAATAGSAATVGSAATGGMQVAATASFPPGRILIHAAGLDPANPSVLGALVQALRSSGTTQGPDLAALSVEGPLDVDGSIDLGSAQAAQNHFFRFFLRENIVQTARNLRLDRLRGVLELRGDKVLLGKEVRANLAGTTLDLADLRYATTPGGFELTTRILPVENLPLDRDHLRAFVDETTLDALLGPLAWRGRIDVRDGRLRVVLPNTGDPRLEFSGQIAASDMQVQLGLPFAVRSASASIEHLVLEGGAVSAVCRITDLYGKIADRELARANLLITYVEPRLSIESLEGEFEGGMIRPLGRGAERGGTAFSIDLEEPFPFQLALDLLGVELSGLFRGLFASNFATRGKVDCQLRLTGDTRRVLGIQGSGSVQVTDSLLWSVPVFRALFSQLGIENTAVFDRLAANVRIRNGVIWTDDITIQSRILELVGKGSIDFDGGVKEDLQVRYPLIDRLGLLTRIVYAIQKELLSVAVRGDLARPQVIFRNPWTHVASQNDRYRSLPLPGLSTLPPRF